MGIAAHACTMISIIKVFLCKLNDVLSNFLSFLKSFYELFFNNIITRYIIFNYVIGVVNYMACLF
jgi:hypothetical protein